MADYTDNNNNEPLEMVLDLIQASLVDNLKSHSAAYPCVRDYYAMREATCATDIPSCKTLLLEVDRVLTNEGFDSSPSIITPGEYKGFVKDPDVASIRTQITTIVSLYRQSGGGEITQVIDDMMRATDRHRLQTATLASRHHSDPAFQLIDTHLLALLRHHTITDKQVQNYFQMRKDLGFFDTPHYIPLLVGIDNILASDHWDFVKRGFTKPPICSRLLGRLEKCIDDFFKNAGLHITSFFTMTDLPMFCTHKMTNFGPLNGQDAFTLACRAVEKENPYFIRAAIFEANLNKECQSLVVNVLHTYARVISLEITRRHNYTSIYTADELCKRLYGRVKHTPIPAYEEDTAACTELFNADPALYDHLVTFIDSLRTDASQLGDRETRISEFIKFYNKYGLRQL